MVIFDTNAVLRYILQDNEEMADAVEALLQTENCFIPTEVIAEMAYVFDKVYKIPRQEAREAIWGVLGMDNVSTTSYAVVLKGLEAYAATSLDFVDCLMAGYKDAGYDVCTFDKALRKYLRLQ